MKILFKKIDVSFLNRFKVLFLVSVFLLTWLYIVSVGYFDIFSALTLPRRLILFNQLSSNFIAKVTYVAIHVT